MNFFFLASFIVFCAWLTYQLHRSRHKEEEGFKSFWDREREANSTRRKPLHDLAYITIPFETLPMELLSDDPKITEYHDILHELAHRPIVNFTCISNTELKLQYGAPNITLLTQYDQSYTILVRTLQQWAEALYQAGYAKEACTILEFSVSTNTDVSRSYFLLADIYKENNMPEKIEQLISTAEQLHSPLTDFIVRTLKAACS